MATLIIPDVHERLDRLTAALRGRIEKASRVVFLGDWYDAFGPVDLRRVGQVCGFINGNIDGIEHEGQVIPTDWLLGNHDCHYFFRSNGFKCSGYNPLKQEVIDANIPQGIIEKFRVFTKVGPYLVSHAGLHEATLGFDKPEVERAALQSAYAGGWDPFWSAGRARGGSAMIGGPTWLDFNYEFEAIDDLPQLVGHTHGKDVKIKTSHNGTSSYCIDTGCNHVAWIDETTGKLDIEAV